MQRSIINQLLIYYHSLCVTVNLKNRKKRSGGSSIASPGLVFFLTFMKFVLPTLLFLLSFFTLLDFNLAVTGHASPCRHQFPDDDILFQSEQTVSLAFNRRFGKDTSRFLERRCRQEGFRFQGSFVIPRKTGRQAGGILQGRTAFSFASVNWWIST